MRRVMLLALVVATTATLAAPAPASARRTVIRATLVTKQDHLVDAPPAAAMGGDFSPGDAIVFSDDVVVRGRTVGHNVGTCLTLSAPVFICHTAVQLRGGTLVLDGLYDAVSTKTQNGVAVVGGTGRYRGARGDLRLRNVDALHSRVVIRFDVPRGG
jgi:hypothetical protein